MKISEDLKDVLVAVEEQFVAGSLQVSPNPMADVIYII